MLPGVTLRFASRFPSDTGRFIGGPGTSRSLLQFVPEFIALFVN